MCRSSLYSRCKPLFHLFMGASCCKGSAPQVAGMDARNMPSHCQAFLGAKVYLHRFPFESRDQAIKHYVGFRMGLDEACAGSREYRMLTRSKDSHRERFRCVFPELSLEVPKIRGQGWRAFRLVHSYSSSYSHSHSHCS